jgi:hypothetical protein
MNEGYKSSIRSRESDGYGSKGSKLFSLIFKNEAILNLDYYDQLKKSYQNQVSKHFK